MIRNTDPSKLSRRSFVIGAAATGGGMAIGFHLDIPGAVAQRAATKAAKATAEIPEVNAWVLIRPNDDVIVRIARSEMGQGTLTGLCQLVAEELECDWAKVKAEYPTPGMNLARKRVWGDMSTGGSRGIRGSHDYVRKGGAAARMMLLAAAAVEWKVPVGEVTVAKGVITHAASRRRTTYGRVAAAAARMTPPEPATIVLKDPKAWTIAGKPMKRLDTAPKVDGTQIYAIDVKLPGMLNAAIRDCPHFGGTLKSFDEAKVKAMPGVRHVLKIGATALAVVADTWWEAKVALDAAGIVWDAGPNAGVSSATINAFLMEGLDAKENVFVANKAGDAAAMLAAAPAAKRLVADYGSPFLNHATMEPMNCTAKWTADKCEVWVASQNGDASLAACAAAAGLKAEQCEVYKFHLGGGFGRRGFQDYVTKAVLAAKQVPGVPIKMIWSREEDMLHGRFRPISVARMSGAVDESGNLVALHMRLSGPSILAYVRPEGLQSGMDSLHFQGLFERADNPFGQIGYTVPNLLIDHAMRNTHIPPGFWRGVNHNQNAVYLECFIDELAKLAGKDPLEFRRAMMARHPKHLAVLNAAADKAGWGTPLPAGVFRGVCQHMGFGSYCAAVAEVSMKPSNKVKVHRLVIAVDSGIALNPEQIAHQVEGSVVYGLGATFYQQCTVKGGKIVEENFDTFPCLMLAEMPKVETVLVPSGGFWGGIGEPTIAVAAPAVLNAIFAATGKMPRTLPLSLHKLV
jgi:isoquinoline 1-oxidoreductase beta subunit